PRPPVTRADSLRADSLRADSLRADSLRAALRADSLRAALRADSIRADSPGADSIEARRDTLPSRRTLPVDTIARAVVDWVPADSAMQELLSRQGYTITRYQGSVVGFDARTRTLRLHGDSLERAAVLRGD